MKVLKYILLVLLTLPIVCCTQGSNQDKAAPHIETIAAEKNIELPHLPWHMMQVVWTFQDSIPDFQRYDIDITISDDVPDTYNLYISVINSAFNGSAFYGGIQTNINGWINGTDQTRVHPGKGGIFSRWSAEEEKPIGLEYVDMFDDGLCESAGYEGEFCSVRRPFKWTKGSYTASLIKEETINHKEAAHTWVSMQITDKETGEVRKIGRLLFEGEYLQMRHHSVAGFVEIYSTDKIPFSNVPEVTVTFGYPKINGKMKSLENVFTRQETQDSSVAKSPNCAYVTSEGLNISVTTTPYVRSQSENDIYNYIILNFPKEEQP